MGVKLHRGFESRPLRFAEVLQTRGRSVAERAYRSLQVSSVDDARHAPALAIADRSPEDAQLADPHAPPGRCSLQRAIVGVRRQRLVGEHVGHCAQGCTVVVGVELAQIALRLSVEFDRDLRHVSSALVVEGAVLGFELCDGIGECYAGLAPFDRLVGGLHRGDVLGSVGEYVILQLICVKRQQDGDGCAAMSDERWSSCGPDLVNHAADLAAEFSNRDGSHAVIVRQVAEHRETTPLGGERDAATSGGTGVKGECEKETTLVELPLAAEQETLLNILSYSSIFGGKELKAANEWETKP
jgi:hypothetical protein